jgi:AAHS family 4-hydroxybenzoate transporter-like MFS transporter
VEATRTVDVADWIDARPIGPRQWRIVALCGAVALLDGLDLQAIGLAAPAMGSALGIAPKDFGPVFSAALAGLALGAFALGPVADRLGRKGVLVAATLLFGLATLATARATGLGDLLPTRFLAGLGLGGAMPSFISLASEYIPRPRRAAAVSLLWAGFPLGGVVGGLLGSHIIPAYGWPSIFLVGGALPIVVAVVLLAVLPESASSMVARGRSSADVARTLRRVFPDFPPGDTGGFAADRDAPAARGTARDLFTGGRGLGTALLWVSFFFAFLSLVTNSSWSPLLLKGLGVPPETTAVALAAYNFASLIGSAVAGALVVRWGPARVLPLALALGAASYAAVGWSAPSVAGITAAEALFGLTMGCASSGLIALSAVFYPVAVRSTGIGWATAVGRAGSFAGPLAVGLLVGAHRGVAEVFAAVAVAVLLGAAASLGLGRGPARPGASIGAKP